MPQITGNSTTHNATTKSTRKTRQKRKKLHHIQSTLNCSYRTRKMPPTSVIQQELPVVLSENNSTEYSLDTAAPHCLAIN
jgi:hypothetical protein